MRESVADSVLNPETDTAGAVSDERLIVAFSRGVPEAFEELFRRYRQPIFGFFRRRIGDATQAEELTQDTFLALIRSAANYKPAATFRTYLYAIAFNILRTHRRKTIFRGLFAGTQEREPSVRSSMDEELMLCDALGRLERVDREILLLREFEQLSYAEIAELAQLPLSTVRSRLFRARMKLRELLTAPAVTRQRETLLQNEERI
jgi:RNA polymerase sigma-70 factor (ECF subfamily)